MVTVISTAQIPRIATPDRPAEIRGLDFGITTETPDVKKTFQQATRCCQCATKGCNRGPAPTDQLKKAPGCPLNTKIPDWMASVASPHVLNALDKILTDAESGTLTEEKLTAVIAQLLQDPAAERELRHAFDLAMERNVLSEILGAVCPQAQELCESGAQKLGTRSTCVAGTAGFEPLTIGNIENLIGRIGRQAGWLEEMLNVPLMRDRKGHTKHISIVGFGPAGMVSAMELRRRGYEVTAFFREDHIGGLLEYGLPGTKLDKSVIKGFEGIFKNISGITLMPNTNVGANEMDQILGKRKGSIRRSDAVILAIGAQTQRPLINSQTQKPIKGDHGVGVVTSLDFLGASIKKHNLGEAEIPEHMNAYGKEVVIIGGGDTAMDCAREAKRQGAKKVTVLYRGMEEEMRAVEKEIKRAKEEGIIFNFRQMPDRIELDEFGHVQKLMCKSGKKDSTTEVPHRTQLVINATGFTAEANLGRKMGIPGLQQSQTEGILVYKPERSTRVLVKAGASEIDEPSSNIFAAGDVVSEQQCLAVHAAASAILAVRQIHEMLTPALKL